MSSLTNVNYIPNFTQIKKPMLGQIKLISDITEYKNSFSRFEDDTLNGYS